MMNDKVILELALSKVKTQLAANIKALSIGRNLNVYASDVNSLVAAKANIEKLLAAIPISSAKASKSKSVTSDSSVWVASLFVSDILSPIK